jgi:hypothetical protein
MLTHNPAIWFAVQRVFVATRPRVGGVVPRLKRPQIFGERMNSTLSIDG